MPTQLRIVTEDEIKAAPGGYYRDPEWWGAMWRTPGEDVDGQEAWCIILPNGAGGWTTTERASIPGVSGQDGYQKGNRWTVTGVSPNLTVSPSINAGDGPGPGNWHGWIKDGVMTP